MAAHDMPTKVFDRLPFPEGGGLSLSTLFKRVFPNAELWWFKRQHDQTTFEELCALSDRELGDIGIARVDIASIAWQSADIAAANRL